MLGNQAWEALMAPEQQTYHPIHVALHILPLPSLKPQTDHHLWIKTSKNTEASIFMSYHVYTHIHI